MLQKSGKSSPSKFENIYWISFKDYNNINNYVDKLDNLVFFKGGSYKLSIRDENKDLLNLHRINIRIIHV